MGRPRDKMDQLLESVLAEKGRRPTQTTRRIRNRAHFDLTGRIKDLTDQGITAIIGEIKPRSPTAGVLRRTIDPCAIVKEMEESDIAGISVLTESHFFGGSPELLTRVAACAKVPLLMKDFITKEEEIDEAKCLGSDAVLLIVRILGDRLKVMYDKALEEGMTPLLEVHNREEMEKAAGLEPDLIGINNRDLSDLSIDLGITEELSQYAPPGTTIISESGYQSLADVERMQPYCHAFLVGSALMRGNIRSKVLELQGRTE